MAVLGSIGKITFLRVHDVGSGKLTVIVDPGNDDEDQGDGQYANRHRGR